MLSGLALFGDNAQTGRHRILLIALEFLRLFDKWIYLIQIISRKFLQSEIDVFCCCTVYGGDFVSILD